MIMLSSSEAALADGVTNKEKIAQLAKATRLVFLSVLINFSGFISSPSKTVER